jgi:polyhydroxyalkanoate synthase subunit PhaC
MTETSLQLALAMMDTLRQQAGRIADLTGAGAVETPFRLVARFSGGRLRAYGTGDGPALLIVPAPFKRPYIWDLMPEVSVVQAALRGGFRVYLLEWLPPNPQEDSYGLADFALHLPGAAASEIQRQTGEEHVHLVGHSLGGTLAAIYAALRPDTVGRLGLIDAPLAFGPDGGPLARAIAHGPSATGVAELVGGPVPGSAINVFSAGAAPEAFVFQRWMDGLASLSSPRARAIHRRVMRWSLDEYPLPKKLFVEIAECLYRDDRFRTGTLAVGAETASLANLSAPVIAVLNPAGRIVPPESILAGLRCAPNVERRVLQYDAEVGPALQHLGPLVGIRAHRTLWPQIVAWFSL